MQRYAAVRPLFNMLATLDAVKSCVSSHVMTHSCAVCGFLSHVECSDVAPTTCHSPTKVYIWAHSDTIDEDGNEAEKKFQSVDMLDDCSFVEMWFTYTERSFVAVNST